MDRNTAYKLGRPKEQKGLDTFKDFATSKLGIDLRFVTDYIENWTKGDYELPNGKYVEVKGQGINPNLFGGNNFIEVGEITNNPLHKDGYEKLSDILGLDIELSEVKVYNKVTKQLEKLGKVENLNISITSLANGSIYSYVNNVEGNFIYLYSAKTLLEEIKYAIGNHKLVRGAGNSHKDSLCLFIKTPVAIWEKINGQWVFIGQGNEEAIINSLKGAN